jgi:hypothetical protein
MRTLTLTLLLALAFVSCQKLTDPVETGNPLLIGSWTDPQYTDTLVTYTRVSNLVENQYGIKFQTGNKLVQRQNSGWCGTPPIVTADYEGTWMWSDSLVNITVGFWGGTADLTWKVIHLNDQKLVISVVKADYHQGK